MESQTVKKAEVAISTEITFYDGVPAELKARLWPKSDQCHEFVTLRIASAEFTFHGGEQQFKAFVGEMIKAVANLK